jgi:hypothetical protein
MGKMAQQETARDPGRVNAVLAQVIRRGEAGTDAIGAGTELGIPPAEAGAALLLLIARGWARLCPDWKCRPTGEGRMMAAAGVGAGEGP